MRMRARISIAAFILVGMMIAVPAIAAEDTAEDDVVAVFKLKGLLAEGPQPVTFGPFLGGEQPTTMFDLLKHLKKARLDNNVKAIIFNIEEARLGFAQIQELRSQIEKLKATDKAVLIFCETLTNSRLLLGSAASQLILMPTGEVVFNGFYAEGSYYKGLLDNIHVEADILHCGDYKSAGEPYYRTGPSKEAAEQTNKLIDSLFAQTIEAVAKSRKLSPERVRELIDVGLFSAEEALKEKLVDKLMYREDFVKSVTKRYGEDAKICFDYGEDDQPSMDMDNPFGIFKFFSEMMKGKEKSDKPAIAIVYVEGAITSGKSEPGLFGGGNAGSTTIRKAIAQAVADDSVKALVLRVDSPGGSAIASDIICEATSRFRDTDRPFIASMGNVAASGGYYVSTLADSIFAEPTTITGSIGVVGGKIVTKGLWEWMGITGHEYKRGKFSDVMNTNRRFDEGQRILVMGMMNRIYGQFKDRVLEGRADRIKGDLEPLAGGRVYTGDQALKIGLVDQLGGFSDAIKYAASEADLGSDYELRVFPEPKTIFELFAEAFGGKDEDDGFVSMQTVGSALHRHLITSSDLGTKLQALRAIDPIKVREIERFLTNVELLANENVLMVGPPCPTVVE